MNKVLFSSKSVEWETPQDLFDKLNSIYHFTLDPCATKNNKKCSKFYSRKDDGLSKNWNKEIVFMNPPYGKEISKWMKKAFESWKQGAKVCCLIPARTDTIWWHDYVEDKAISVNFIKGRLNFGGKYNAPFPSVLVFYW